MHCQLGAVPVWQARVSGVGAMDSPRARFPLLFLLIYFMILLLLASSCSSLQFADHQGPSRDLKVVQFKPKLAAAAPWSKPFFDQDAEDEFQPTKYWNAAMLHEGTVVPGYKQLHGLLRKLHSGKPITVVVLGTSISENGGCFHRDMDHLEASVGVLRFPRETIETKCDDNKVGYVRNFMTVINSTWPHPDHLAVNMGLSGHRASTFANMMCLEHHIPAHADLAIIEQVSELVTQTDDLERLLQRLRSAWRELPPVLLLISSRTHPGDVKGSAELAAAGCEVDCECVRFAERCESSRCRQLYSTYPPPESFKEAPGEGPTHALAAYYGLASLSLRTLLGAWVRDGLLQQLQTQACSFLQQLFADPVHPTAFGNALISDMLVAHLAAAEQHLGEAIAAGAVPDISAEGSSSSAGADSAGAEEAGGEAGGKAAGSRRKRALLPVPQLLPWRAPSVPLSGGFKALVSRCYLMQHPQHQRGNHTSENTTPHAQQKHQKQQQQQQQQGQKQQAKAAGGAAGGAAGSSGGGSAPQALQVTSRSPSWSWTDVQEDGGTKHKPGWYSKEVGSHIEFLLDTRFQCPPGLCSPATNNTRSPAGPAGSGAADPSSALAGSSAQAGRMQASVVLTILSSYQNMGMAELSCTQGCTCSPKTANGHTPRKHSVPRIIKLPVSQHEACRVRLAISEATDSGGHKFKVTGVGVEGLVVYTAAARVQKEAEVGEAQGGGDTDGSSKEQQQQQQQKEEAVGKGKGGTETEEERSSKQQQQQQQQGEKGEKGETGAGKAGEGRKQQQEGKQKEEAAVEAQQQEQQHQEKKEEQQQQEQQQQDKQQAAEKASSGAKAAARRAQQKQKRAAGSKDAPD